MNTYLAEEEKDGIEFTHGFDAESWPIAEKIAEKYGWTLICEIPDDDNIYEPTLESVSVH